MHIEAGGSVAIMTGEIVLEQAKTFDVFGREFGGGRCDGVG